MRNQILAITYGSMYVGIGAVFGIFNLFSGGFFDIILVYVLTLGLMLYAYRFSMAQGLLSALALFMVLIMIGNLFFAGYSLLTVALGAVLAKLLKNGVPYYRCWMTISFLAVVKNIFVFIVLGELFLMNGIQEAQELTSMFGLGQEYVMLVYGATPVLIGFMESLIINNYSRFVLMKIQSHYKKGR